MIPIDARLTTRLAPVRDWFHARPDFTIEAAGMIRQDASAGKPRRLIAVLLVALGVCLGSGCGEGGGQSLELGGPEILTRLPESVRPLIPAGAILCLDEKGSEGSYTLQILRQPGGTWLRDPDKKPTGWEQHGMPATALEGLLATKLPSLSRGALKEPRSRLTHWQERDKSEIQIREILTDQGWFASIERIVP